MPIVEGPAFYTTSVAQLERLTIWLICEGEAGRRERARHAVHTEPKRASKGEQGRAKVGKGEYKRSRRAEAAKSE